MADRGDAEGRDGLLASPVQIGYAKSNDSTFPESVIANAGCSRAARTVPR